VASKTVDELVKNKPEDLAREAIRDSNLLLEVFKGISSLSPKVKFKSAKILTLISERNPQKLYPRIDFFIGLLDSGNQILKWNAIDVIANLASVDVNKRFEKIFDKFYGLLEEGSLITAGHVIDNSWKIVNAKPTLERKITKELLKVEKVSLPTDECRNILFGHTLLSFDQYFDKIQDRNEVIAFAKRQLNNSRNATKIKAEKFLKKHAAHVSTNMKVTTIKQKMLIPATPDEVYEAFMDAKKHSAFTGSKATCDPKVGGKFTAWAGYISGRNLELERGKKIVQEWSTTDWPEAYLPSKLELTFQKTKGGTEISVIHSDVPVEQADDLAEGWVKFYWKPMKEYFARNVRRR